MRVKSLWNNTSKTLEDIVSFPLDCIAGKTHYNFFQLKYQFISSIWHDYLTRISQISQNYTSLSLVCSRPDGKREWNDAFSRDLRDSRETKSCVKREYFYNAYSLDCIEKVIYRCATATLLLRKGNLAVGQRQGYPCPAVNKNATYV